MNSRQTNTVNKMTGLRHMTDEEHDLHETRPMNA